MRHVVVAFLFYILSMQTGNSQTANKPFEKGSIFLRFNPLGLVDLLDGNISFGGEFRINDRWSYAQDLGLVFYSHYFPEAQRATGIIVRPAIRYYLKKNHHTFIEAELHYKYVSYRMEDWVGRNCVNNVPAYEEFTRFSIRKHVTGLQVKYGSQTSISADKKWWLEIYLGLAVRYRDHKADLDDHSCYAFDNVTTTGGRIIFMNYDNGFRAAFPFGARLLYRLR